FFFCFFFSSRRRHTRLQGDWSSDVCSSDLHFLTHELAHLVELFRRWLFVFQSDDVLAYGGGAEEGGDIARNAALFQITQIFRQGVPFDRELDVRLFANDPRFHPII